MFSSWKRSSNILEQPLRHPPAAWTRGQPFPPPPATPFVCQCLGLWFHSCPPFPSSPTFPPLGLRILEKLALLPHSECTWLVWNLISQSNTPDAHLWSWFGPLCWNLCWMKVPHLVLSKFFLEGTAFLPSAQSWCHSRPSAKYASHGMACFPL